MEALLSSRPPQYDGQDHKASWGRHYPLKGQGTLIFNLVRNTPVTISISPAVAPVLSCSTPGYIALKIGKDKAQFILGKPDGSEQIVAETAQVKPGFVPEYITSYWYSFDHFNLIVKYGKGYIMEETTLLSHNFIPENATEIKKEEIRKEMSFIFSPTVRKVVTLYDVAPLPLLKQLYLVLSSAAGTKELANTQALYAVGTKQKLEAVKTLIGANSSINETGKNQGDIEVEKKVDFYNFPLVSNLSPLVKDSSEVTLFDLDDNKYMFSASLPATCSELYSNVKNADLNWSPLPEKYKLSDAIRYSLDTPGCLLNKKVEEKRKEAQFGEGEDAKNQVYLRVTLGLKRGTSPGIPYVLEIWPKGCGSPIHNHGNTYAVIHVLFGALHIHVFNKDLISQQQLTCLHVEEGDITWISPNWYQTHRLWNHSNDYCATIQCYQYGKDDNVSWPYFDYLSTTSQIDEFLPDSDFTFSEMRTAVMKEYSDHMKCQDSCK